MSSQSLKYGHLIRVKSNDSRTHSYITSKSYHIINADTRIPNCIFKLMATRTTKTNSMSPTTGNPSSKYSLPHPSKSMTK